MAIAVLYFAWWEDVEYWEFKRMVAIEMRLDMEFPESVWQEQLEKFREIVDYSPLEIFDFEAELITGQLTYANRAAQQTLGYTREEMLRLKVIKAGRKARR